eukprot:gene18117-24860_t
MAANGGHRWKPKEEQLLEHSAEPWSGQRLGLAEQP